MANLSIRRLDDEVVTRLKIRAQREKTSLEETVRRILRTAVVDEEPVGTMIRRIVGNDGYDLELPKREFDEAIDLLRHPRPLSRHLRPLNVTPSPRT